MSKVMDKNSQYNKDVSVDGLADNALIEQQRMFEEYIKEYASNNNSGSQPGEELTINYATVEEDPNERGKIIKIMEGKEENFIDLKNPNIEETKENNDIEKMVTEKVENIEKEIKKIEAKSVYDAFKYEEKAIQTTDIINIKQANQGIVQSQLNNNTKTEPLNKNNGNSKECFEECYKGKTRPLTRQPSKQSPKNKKTSQRVLQFEVEEVEDSIETNFPLTERKRQIPDEAFLKKYLSPIEPKKMINENRLLIGNFNVL